MLNLRSVASYFFVVAATVFCQDCFVPGHDCGSHNECCGGCCWNNVCTKTYELCTLHDNACLTHYCPPGLECYTFTPNCQGCETTWACK